MRKIVTLLLLLAVFSTVRAQDAERILQGREADALVRGAELIRFVPRSAAPNYLRMRPELAPDLSETEGWFRKVMGAEEADEWVLLKAERDNLNHTHFSLQQTYEGLPVEGAVYKIHAQNGRLQSMSGEFFPGISLNPTAGISEAAALQAALDHVGADVYRWELAAEENLLKVETGNPNASYYPFAEMAVAPRSGDAGAGDFRLCYKFDIYAAAPLSRAYIFVDAQTGEVIWTQDRIHHADVVGTAMTAYSGTQSMTADFTGSNYRLQETGRGNGIRTYDMNQGTNYGSAVDFTDSDNIWNNVNAQQDEVATDAHWGAEMTYDYFYIEHGRNSIDGNGFNLVSYVHYDNGYNNAFWDGQRMTYGDGNGSTFTPLTAIDVTGHEISHGLTTFSANLVYQNESGALNESFSDIFGNTIEHYARPTQWSWKVGEDMTPSGNGIRSMQNPGAYGDPDTYFGNNWYTGTADNGGVHTNSGVQNKWYYILTIGESGTNDNGDSYNVTGQGWTKAAAIAFRNLTVYLSTYSEYADARFYAIQSATDLYGPCTAEVIATTDAWYAVGVGSPFSFSVTADFQPSGLNFCSAPATVTFGNQSINGGSFYWDFGDGNTSTSISPQHTYNSLGTYTVSLIAYGGPCGNDTLVQTALISVDTSNACEVNLPPSGTADTQTACSGTLYDSGGGSNPYGANEDAQITIAPTGASTVTLDMNFFDVEAGSSGNNCNYDYLDIFDGPSPASPLIGRYCNNNPPPLSITSSAGSITLVFHSDPGLEEDGFIIAWSCTMPNSPPVADFTADNLTSCNGIVQFTDLTTNGAISWDWDFGDGFSSTQQDPLHTYLSNGVYTVTMIATNLVGADTVVKTAYITVSKPAGPSATGASRCGPGTLTLTATGTDLSWYDAAVGGNLVGTGPSFTTPVLTNSVVYYVEEETPATSQYVGPATPAAVGGGGYHNNTSTQYLEFTVYSDLTLKSAYVDPGASGNRTFTLWDGTGTLIRDTTISVGASPQRVEFNWELSPGNYRIGGTEMDLYRNNSGPAYPYSISNFISITGSSAGASYYYYLYDWEVTGRPCVSERTAVPATIDVLPTVSVSPGPSVDICPGNNVTLTASGANSYAWSTGGSGTSISVNTAGTYYAIGTNAQGCSDTSAVVTVNVLTPAVAIVPQGPTMLCPGDSVILMAPSGSGYVWSTGATTQSITVNTTGTYTVTMTDVNGCTGSDAETVTVTSTPTATITPSGSTALCAGDDVTLTATTGSSYLWSTGATSQSLVISTAGTYTVTVTYPGGCSAIASPISVTVNTPPTAAISASNGTVLCDGDSTALTASGGTAYAWSNGGSGATISVNSSGTYTVTVTDANGCSDTDSMTVTVNSAPSVSISSSNGTTLCDGESTDLTASGGTSYVWSTGGSGAMISVNSSGTYTVTVTGANGCSTTDNITVTVNALPTAAISSSNGNAICDGESTDLTASGGTSFAWSTGGSGAMITASTSGTYTVTVTDANGCSATDNFTLTVNPLPTVSMDPFSGPVCLEDAPYTLTGSPSGGAFSGTGVSAGQFDPSAAGVGTYVLTYTYTDGNGCSNSDSVSVTVEICAAVQDALSSTEIVLYPNPNTGTFNVTGLPAGAAGTVYDAIGKRVYDFTANGGIEMVQLSSTAKGNYFLRVQHEGAVRTLRFQVR